MSSISHLHVAYGSESGNAETLANQFIQQPFIQQYSHNITSLNETDLTTLDQNSLLLIITSSFGDGETPENAQDFLDNLTKNTTMCSSYAIFGLGDVVYDKFCGYAKDVDNTLRMQLWQPLIERVDADLNYQEIFKQWLPLVEKALANPTNTPIEHKLSAKAYSENTTYRAKVLEIKSLAQANPPVYHIRLSLQDSGIFYQAGDLIYVKVAQPNELLSTFSAWYNDETATEILRHKELRLLSKNILRNLSKICGNNALKDLVKISNKKALEQYIYRHDLLDVLRDFDPEKKIRLTDLAELVGNLTPRAYSISSCGKTHTDYVDLCVRQVQYQLAQRHYYGTASHQLSELKIGDFIEIFATSNPTFHLPEDSTVPIVMIGSGTGIAPFIGFLQYRSAQQNSAESYLFFAERYRAKDFLYQAELEQYLAQGSLTQLFTAFSRDQREKYYVQNALAEQAELVWKLIEKGAYFYVCGNKTMSKAVDDTHHNSDRRKDR